MTHTSLYRKWRPQTFADVTGQTHVIQTLSNALSQGRISHAYLFSGPRGTGKTTVARLLAKSLNCARGTDAKACNECENCRRITRGTSMDVLEIDGASNRGIDEIREVRESIRFSPAEGRYRVYIIDEIHMLTQEAFNALLKVLEEPPAHGVFIFATTEPHRVPATVLSRCQRFDFRPLFPGEIRERLETVCRGEGIAYEERALDAVARHADGALRDALSILDQCIAFEGDRLTEAGVEQVIGVAPREWFHRLVDMLARGDVADGFRLVQDLRNRGKDLRQFVRDACRHVRDLMVLAGAPDVEGLVEGVPDDREAMIRQARALGVERLLEAMQALLRAEADMRWAPNPQLVLETVLVTLAVGPREEEPAPVRERPPEGAPAPPPPSPAPGEAARPVRRPKAAPAASAAEAAGTEAAVWNRLLARLREERQHKLAAFLIEGTPVAEAPDGAIVVEFPPDRRFHRDSFERDAQRALVEKMLGDILGKPASIRTRIAGEGHGEGGSQAPAGEGEGPPFDRGPVPPEAPGPAEGTDEGAYPPAVQRALRLFGGKVTATERGEDGQ